MSIQSSKNYLNTRFYIVTSSLVFGTRSLSHCGSCHGAPAGGSEICCHVKPDNFQTFHPTDSILMSGAPRVETAISLLSVHVTVYIVFLYIVCQVQGAPSPISCNKSGWVQLLNFISN